MNYIHIWSHMYDEEVYNNLILFFIEWYSVFVTTIIFMFIFIFYIYCMFLVLLYIYCVLFSFILFIFMLYIILYISCDAKTFAKILLSLFRTKSEILMEEL